MIPFDFDPNGVGVDNGSYFGMPFTEEQAQLVLVSAPWDVTVSYGAGTADAPDAIIEASTQLDFYDPSSPGAWRHGIATAPIDYSILELSQHLRPDAERVIEHLEQGGDSHDDYISRRVKRINDGCREVNRLIEQQCRPLVDAGKIVGLVGGDHSTPYGAIKALASKGADFGILHIDAHRDLRCAYEGFEFSHASIMYNVLRDVPQVSRLVQVGVRDFCDDEIEVVEQSAGRIVSFDDHALSCASFEGEAWGSVCRRIVEQLPQDVYVSFDIDGLQMSYCPHTGTPVSGGLSFNQAAYLLEVLVASGRKIVGFDLVEVTPHKSERIDAIVGARMLYKLCGLAIQSNL